MLIDIHQHYIPQRFIDLVSRDSKHFQTAVYHDEATGLVGLAPGMTDPPAADNPARSIFLIDRGMADLSVRLEEITLMGLDMAALSVSPLVYYYFAEPTLGAEISRILNDGIHEVVTAYPDRFVGMGTVPLQDVAAAIAELERAVKEYGFTAIEIGGSVNGKGYDEPEFDAFFRRAEELDIFIFIHPLANPSPDRLTRYHTGNLIGFPVESGICAASLIFGGVLARYPNIKICFAHGGGILPGLIGRWDHGWEARSEAKVHIDKPPSTYFKQLYFDDLVHSDAVLRALLDISSADHIVVGTDYPYDMGERQPGAVIERQNLTPAQRQAMESGTAARLLRIEDRLKI